MGILWGLGHGLSATLLGLVAFSLKRSVFTSSARLRKLVSSASQVSELAVGLSLVTIGIMGLNEAREWYNENQQLAAVRSLSAGSATDPLSGPTSSEQKRAILFNGLLHGFSWDGAPSLAPALALATWGSNLAFLGAYAVGTMTTMALTTTVIGEGTRRAGKVFERPDLPQKVSMLSSVFAVCVGAIWCGVAVKGFL